MEPEIVMNLWVFIQLIGPAQIIHELGVRPYMMKGSDAEMTSLLKVLSISDFHLARRFPVPDRYTLNFKEEDGSFRAIAADGGTGRQGLTLVQPMISGMAQMEYFKEALDATQASIPARRIGLQSSETRTPTVNRKNLLSVITSVIVDDQGNQIAKVDDSRRTQVPSVSTNLWLLQDRSEQAVFALSGRGYMIHGSDSDKTRVLKALAPHDFAMVESFAVPEKFGNSSEAHPGAFLLTTPSGNTYSKDLFGKVFAAIEKEVPTSIGIDGKMSNSVSVSARSALSVATKITDHGANQLEAISVNVA